MIIPELTKDQETHLRQTKNYLHQHPETSWQEFNTTEYIKSQLNQIEGIEILEENLKTGVIAVIHGSRPGHSVALRADIDALDVNECWTSEYPSLIPGKGHLCGHDFHTASLIGAAILLAQTRDLWQGSVILIFQPAKETTNGACEIIKTGIFDKYQIKAIFGLHNRPEVETGKIVVKPAPLMAAKINFEITVYGVGGHGSMPHKCVDPIVCAASIVQNVLTITSRNIDPFKAIVLSICSIHGGTPANLIVDKVEMTGSMRYLDPDVGQRAFERLQKIIQSTAETFECRAVFKIVEHVHPVINSEQLYEIAKRSAQIVLGDACMVESESALASEDFSEYMQRVPGFFYWLGCRQPGEKIYSWHHNSFHTDDNALKYGSRLLAQSAVECLNS